ncbi:DcaP family trimeric outer membrane transporter [Marinobacter sp.]|uniref:DcaP family trimeric outer membrane transporter n=1 Tax=Marinobacter sp. TaxID=50741 RepID=UPI003566B64A
MPTNKLRMAIRATAAMTVLGLASQAQAFEVQAGDVKADIYGYARLTATYDINEKITGDDSTLAGDFGMISDSDNEGHFDASATQSRIGVSTMLPQDVKVVIEGDFASGGNFRLRHAFGEYKGILAGQTWSNFSSFTGNTPTLDFNGAAGWAGYQARTAQLRYTTGGLSVSVEDPKGSVSAGTKKDASPAFTARYEGSSDAMAFSAAALVKQTAYDNSDTGGEDDSTLGFGVFGAANFKVSESFSIQGNVVYTDGANGYLYLSGAPDGYVDANNDLETISGLGASLGTSFALGGGRSVNLVYGMTQMDVDNATDEETRSNILANYMWTPVKNVMMGVEYQYWKTETKGGNSEDANRLMLAAQYNF